MKGAMSSPKLPAKVLEMLRGNSRGSCGFKYPILSAATALSAPSQSHVLHISKNPTTSQ